MKKFYYWNDAADPYVSKVIDLNAETLFTTKAKAKKDFKGYAAYFAGDAPWTPRMELYRVTVEKV